VFAARERGAIRGFTKVRRLILDEAQILSESAVGYGADVESGDESAGHHDGDAAEAVGSVGGVVTNLRAEAFAGTSHGVLYVELAAPAGSKPDDRHAWKIANPSYPEADAGEGDRADAEAPHG
jgi:hypothetical protein